ncbi:MAG: GNAT family N-acetyltransferase [Spirochaetales bacterium]|nr:GNAT family N-acetyltransferase [Spirochaetales bacterium]
MSPPAPLRFVGLPTDAPSFIEAALPLALAAYDAERAAVPCLPTEGAAAALRARLEGLFSRGRGIAAFSGDALVGYLAGYPVASHFGECGGVHVPLHGHARAGRFGAGLVLSLYERAAASWVRDGLLSHTVTAYAHDEAIIEAWFRNGFGMRCADAMRAVPDSAPEAGPPEGVRIVEADAGHAAALAPLHRAHNEFYRRSPLFMFHPDEDPAAEFLEWIGDPRRSELVALAGELPLGFIRLGSPAENFASSLDCVRNIQGLYVTPSARGRGVARALVDAAFAFCARADVPLLGVDYETLNRPAAPSGKGVSRPTRARSRAASTSASARTPGSIRIDGNARLSLSSLGRGPRRARTETLDFREPSMA